MINSEVFSIYGSDNEHLGYGIVTLANGCKLGGCINPGDIDPETEHEQFYFSVLYDKSGHIKGVKVLEYTSQYGYEITAKSWLKQFIGYKAGQLRVGKEIDGISGATISVHSIVNSLNIQQKLLKDTLVSN
ncbi:MAG: FMN-binding protein [Bacteroidia bacterium]|nr:FMN-binding protein [Bacteroidia bacterium]